MEVKEIVVTAEEGFWLGYQGENEVTKVVFLQSSELLAYNWALLHRRSTDVEAYPVPLGVTADGLVWTVTSGDTAISGEGKAQLICTGDNGEILKTSLYTTFVSKSLPADGEVPDPVKPWYDDIMQQLEQAGGGTVKTVNGVEPDKSGNVEIDVGMSANNPVGTGSFSMGRLSGSTVGSNSHAEGLNTTASGNASHAEGRGTTASGNCAHAEGRSTTASGSNAHAEGYNSEASGEYAHAEGRGTKASGSNAHAEGKYNIEDTDGKYSHVVGNGTSDTVRSNAHTLDWNGVPWFQGRPQFGGTAQDDGSQTVMANGDTEIILVSPNGKKWKITVSDDGTLTTTEVTA